MGLRLYSYSVALVLLLCGGTGLSAQEYTQVPVTVSSEKVRGSDGKVYYSHVVQERQTLYSISKAYGVTIDEICQANPGTPLLTEGPKKNAILLIPVREHTPDIQAGKQEDDSYFIHIVRWYEDISDIAAKYGISAERILKFNGLDASQKLKNRMKLKIPRENAPVETAPEPLQVPQDSAKVSHTERKTLLDNILSVFETKKENVNLCLLLPFAKSGNTGTGSLDFYSGVLLAIRDLGSQGISTNLSVYDVSGGATGVTSAKLKETDAVIGPISPRDISAVSAINVTGTPVISPLDPKGASLAVSSDFIIQGPTPAAEQYEDLALWLKDDWKNGDKILIVSEKGVSSSTGGSRLIQTLSSQGVPYGTFEYSILQGRTVENSLARLLTASGTNRIVLNTDNEGFAYDVVRNLNLLSRNIPDIVLYSPSKIRSWNTMEVELLHKLNLHTSTSFHIDYDSPAVRDFLLAYRAVFRTEPTNFAFQGYDLATFVIKACYKYGNGWKKALPGMDRFRGMQSDFLFREIEGGGYVNHAVRRVIYNKNYTVALLQ